MPKKRRAELSLLAIAITVFAVDQTSKALVLRYLPYQHSWNPIPALSPLVMLTHVTNTGAAFGLFPGGGLIFAVVALAVVAGVLFSYRHLPHHLGWVHLSLGLQLGGAIGNLIDRLRFGWVVDFIDLRFWPVFNVADGSIVVGVSILAYYLIFLVGKPLPQQEDAQTEGA